MAGIPASYTVQAEEVQRGQNAKIQHLLAQVAPIRRKHKLSALEKTVGFFRS
jgi:hypothetical protein